MALRIGTGIQILSPVGCQISCDLKSLFSAFDGYLGDTSERSWCHRSCSLWTVDHLSFLSTADPGLNEVSLNYSSAFICDASGLGLRHISGVV